MKQTTSYCPASWILEARHKQVLRRASVHINKTVQIIKMGMDAAKSSALQPRRDFVVWNVGSVCVTRILETVNYIFLFVKEVHIKFKDKSDCEITKKVCQVPSGASAEIEILGKHWLKRLF